MSGLSLEAVQFPDPHQEICRPREDGGEKSRQFEQRTHVKKSAEGANRRSGE
jgi:hypothetical protein